MMDVIAALSLPHADTGSVQRRV